MKVALCHHYSLTFHGGGERFLIELARQLEESGHKAEIYALPFGHRPINTDKQLHGINHQEGLFHDISDADLAYFIYAPIVHHFFRGACPKIAGIHAFVFMMELQHPEIQQMSSAVFVREFGWSRFLSHRYFNAILKRNLSSFDAIHVINKEAMKVAFRSNQVYYAPNWIDTSRFKPTGEKEERFSALFIGRKAKGFKTFLAVAELLKHQNIDFFAIGPDVRSVENVKSLGFITDVEELVRLYSKVHALIYTSAVDVFPLTLLESCACETPVVALKTKAIEGLGLPIFQLSSTGAIAHKAVELEELWESEREKYSSLVKQLRANVLKYDVTNVFPRYLRMFKEVASCGNT
jgi:glycosyltransferase involved in cell wall biosynthesis